MSDKKYSVPSERVKRAWNSVGYMAVTIDNMRVILEAFAADVAENPVSPTSGQICSMLNDPPNNGKLGNDALGWLFCEWQRRMFLAPEAEVPDAVRDLLVATPTGHGNCWNGDEMNAAIIEAYNRGKAGK